MLEVQKYLETHTYEQLTEELGINVREYDDRVCLSYNQINSTKKHPITIECRGLILDKLNNIICRPFDRFFNYGECEDLQEDFDIIRATAYEKIDGSLIKVYCFDENWEIATRGTAFAESETSFGDVFRDLVLEAFGRTEEGFQNFCNYALNPEVTYIFELTSLSNKIVKFYQKEPLIWILGARETLTGKHLTDEELDNTFDCFDFVKKPKRFTFGSVLSILETAKHLTNLDEGYVCWDKTSNLRIKVKSPTYVAAHRMKGEGIVSMKSAVELILNREEVEFLTYFPEYTVIFEESKLYIDTVLGEADSLYLKYKDIEPQKEFALKVKDHDCSALLFQARAKGFATPKEAFSSWNDASKIRYFTKKLK